MTFIDIFGLPRTESDRPELLISFEVLHTSNSATFGEQFMHKRLKQETSNASWTVLVIEDDLHHAVRGQGEETIKGEVANVFGSPNIDNVCIERLEIFDFFRLREPSLCHTSIVTGAFKFAVFTRLLAGFGCLRCCGFDVGLDLR